MRNEGPPRLAEWLLARCLPAGLIRETVLGDLHQRFAARASHARSRQGLWYWRQAAQIGSSYLLKRALGGSDHTWSRREEAGKVNVGDGWLRDVLQDGTLALRQLWRSPTFSIIAILTLGLGIGVNTAVFSAALETFRPVLPFSDSDGLVRVYQVPDSRPLKISPRVPVFLELTKSTTTLERVAASRFTNLTLTTDDGPRRVIGNAVTPGWLELLGVEPALGRSFSQEEESAGRGSRVVVISHATWQNRFGSSAQIIGTNVRLNDEPHSIVGVLPRGFNYPYNAEFWVPFRPEDNGGGAFWALNLKGRLAPGATHAQVVEELSAISRRLGGVVEGFGADMTLTPVPIREVLLGGDQRTLGWLAGAVGFVLLIVCTNIANLLLSRALDREPEFALRASLGASSGRLLRQTLVESLVLTLLGGLVGVAVAWMGTALMTPLLPGNLVALGAGLQISGEVLAFALLVSVSTGLLLGLVPGIRVSMLSPERTLRRGSRTLGGDRSGRITSAIMVAELAATLVLLAGVGAMIQSFQNVRGLELGYDSERMILFSVALDREPHATGPARSQFVDLAVDLVSALPDVGAVGATTMFPRHGGNTIAQLEAEGQPIDFAAAINANDRMVSPDYLPGLGARLLAGRWLQKSDVGGTESVTVVNSSLAERLWPSAGPLGRRLRNVRDGPEAPWNTVVGVVADVHEADDIEYSWYRPYAQNSDQANASQVTLFARGNGPLSTPPIRAIRAALNRIDPNLPVFDVGTAEQVVAEAIGRERRGARLGGGFAGFGLILAAMGMYGTISCVVARRRKEFGIRLALGSNPSAIVADVLIHVGQLVLLGIGAGLAGAVVLVRLLSAQISGVLTPDWISFALAMLLLSLTALFAAAVPAFRAARADPMETLAAN